jgi:hypothetical protein
LVQLYQLEMNGGTKSLRLVPKLTPTHIYLNGFKTMSVKLAAQLFSHSVAAGNNHMSELVFVNKLFLTV